MESRVTQPPVGHRDGWMDAARGIAVLMIVVFHSATLLRFAGLEAPAAVTAVNTFFAPFRIPMLVVLSGLLVPQSLRKGTATYLWGKVRNVAWPFLLWTTFYLATTHPAYDPANKYAGGSYLWFLAFLFIYYGLALLLWRAPPSVIIALALVCSVLAEDGTKWGERYFVLLAFFMAGVWAARRPAAWEALLRSRVVLATSAVVVVAFAAVALTLPEPVHVLDTYGPFTVPASAAGILLVVRGLRRVGEAPGLGFLRFAGRHSVVYYVSHFQVVYVVVHVAARFAVDSPWLLFAVNVVVAVGAATLCAWLRDRAPWLRLQWLFSLPLPTRRSPPRVRVPLRTSSEGV